MYCLPETQLNCEHYGHNGTFSKEVRIAKRDNCNPLLGQLQGNPLLGFEK
jgi:hypothetical protein